MVSKLGTLSRKIGANELPYRCILFLGHQGTDLVVVKRLLLKIPLGTAWIMTKKMAKVQEWGHNYWRNYSSHNALQIQASPSRRNIQGGNEWCHGGYIHLLYCLLLSLPFWSKRKGQPLITLLVDKYRCSSYFENFGIANKSASFLSGQFAVLDVAGLSLQRMPHPTDRHSIVLNLSHAKLTEAARLYKDCCRHMQSNTVTLETAARQEVHRRDRFIPTICSSYKV